MEQQDLLTAMLCIGDAYARYLVKKSKFLGEALAMTSRKLATAVTGPQGVQALTAFPAVRQIGIGEVARRINSKSILRSISSELLGAAGTFQLYAGQWASCKAAASALSSVLMSQKLKECCWLKLAMVLMSSTDNLIR